MNFREPLPVACPPIPARVPPESEFWRLLKSASPKDSDFDSQFHKNKNRPFSDLCRAKGVSLVPTLALCRSIVASPRMSAFTHAVVVKHDPAAGIWDKDKPEHVTWWPYAGTSPLQLLGAVERL